jgi:hypothetical protein
MNVQLNEKGEVKAQWVKKIVPKSKWSEIEANPSYHTLSQSDNGRIVAFIRPLYDEPLPHHLDACTVYEAEKLNRKYDERS